MAYPSYKQSGSVTFFNLKHTVGEPSTAQDLVAGTTILANALVIQVKASGGSVTITSTPTIADGIDGQLLIIVNVDTANNVVLQDQGTLGSSNLRLSANTITLAPRDNIILLYNATIGDWIQIGQTNVL